MKATRRCVAAFILCADKKVICTRVITSKRTKLNSCFGILGSAYLNSIATIRNNR